MLAGMARVSAENGCTPTLLCSLFRQRRPSGHACFHMEVTEVPKQVLGALFYHPVSGLFVSRLRRNHRE